MSRPSIVATLGAIAEVWAQRSTCSRRHVGAVITSHGGVIVSSGYNGAPVGYPHCDHSCDCPGGNFDGHKSTCRSLVRCEVSIHAEENAILFAARYGVATQGRVMVCTHAPCWRCARMIHQADLSRVVYRDELNDSRGLDFLREMGVEVLKLKDLP